MMDPFLAAYRLRRQRDLALDKAGQANRDGDSAHEELWLSEARRFEDKIRSLREGHGTKKEICDV